jgi:hypothetical protein
MPVGLDDVSELRRLTGLSMESQGGMILTGETKNSEKNLSHFYFVHYKFYMD